MKFQHLFFLFLIFFIPNVKSESLSENNTNSALKENIFNEIKERGCKKTFSDYLICEEETKSGINFKIENNDGLLLAEYSVSCLEGYVKGTAINNNDKNINEIIVESINKTCKTISERKIVLKASYNLPDSTNKNSELICNPYDLTFSKNKFEVCKAHDDQDNFLIRINDSGKDQILAQITGNCNNPDLHDNYFNKKDINKDKITTIRKEVLPKLKNKICETEVDKDIFIKETNFVNIKDPSSEAYLKMANARYKVGDLRIAMKEVNRSISINPFNSFAYNSRGKILRDMGYFNSALSDFNKAIELNPEIIEFYIHRLNIFQKKKLYNEALNDFDKIIALKPDSNDWLLKRGLLKIKLLKYDEALTDINEYISSEKNNSLAYRNRGIIHLNFGNFENACSDLLISKNLNDNKTVKLLDFINSKNPSICDSIEMKTSNNLSLNMKEESIKKLEIKKGCNKNTFVMFDDKESCFN